MQWWRSLRQRWAVWHRSRRVGLWFHQAYGSAFRKDEIPNMELHRGERILGQLLQEGLVDPDSVQRPPVVEIRQLGRFHTQAWLERSMQPSELGRIFGLDPSEVDADIVLHANRRMVGGTVAAARAVARGDLEVAINLGGGFHHAEPELGSGFCVYNDIGVAISDLRASGFDEPIAIVDLDFHQGNGNTIAYAEDKTVLVYSIHGSVWSHLDASAGYEKYLAGVVNDRRYLSVLRNSLREQLHKLRPKLVFYIAGADVLDGDRLGSYQLSPAGVFARDRFVYESARQFGAGLVVTMGGGYSKQAWHVYYQFIRSLLTGIWELEPQATPPSLRARYASIAASLNPIDLQRKGDEDDFGFSVEDIMGALGARAPSDKFLDFYGKAGFEYALETYGIMEKIHRHGYFSTRMEGDPTDHTRQIIRVFGTKAEREYMLLEFIFRKMGFQASSDSVARREVLFIEWLLLQDPTRSFSLERSPLPGQEFPGLGIAREMQELLVQACRRLKLVGIMNRPSHYHNAVYCQAEWRFVDPTLEGRFRALMAAASRMSLYEATWAVERGQFRLSDGTPLQWQPGDHVLPVESELAELVHNPEYQEAVLRERARLLERGLQAKIP